MFFQVNQASKLPHALAYRGQARGCSRCRLDTIDCLSVSSKRIIVFCAALLARCTRSYVGARIRLQLVQLLGQFPQHAGAEAGAALGHGSAQAVRKQTTCRKLIDRHAGAFIAFTYRIDMMGCMLTCLLACCRYANTPHKTNHALIIQIRVHVSTLMMLAEHIMQAFLITCL